MKILQKQRKNFLTHSRGIRYNDIRKKSDYGPQ